MKKDIKLGNSLSPKGKEPMNNSSLADSTVHVHSVISLFFVLQTAALLAALLHKNILCDSENICFSEQ